MPQQKLIERVNALKEQHKVLHNQVEMHQAAFAPDHVIKKLKVQKADIKTQIAELESLIESNKTFLTEG